MIHNFWIFIACKAVQQVVEKIRSKKNTLYVFPLPNQVLKVMNKIWSDEIEDIIFITPALSILPPILSLFPRINQRTFVNPTPLQYHGVAHFSLLCKKNGISEPTIQELLESIEPKTLSQYSGIQKRFYNWINISENACEINRSLMRDFLSDIYIIKAMLQFLELDAFSIETIPVDLLSLKKSLQIIKTFAIIAITSDRGHALHLMNIEKMYIADACISFIRINKLKTTKQVLKPKLVKYVIPPTKPWRLKVKNVEG